MSLPLFSAASWIVEPWAPGLFRKAVAVGGAGVAMAGVRGRCQRST